jgi:hypothetical protein
MMALVIYPAFTIYSWAVYTLLWGVLQLGVLQSTVGRCNLCCVLQFTFYHLLLGTLPFTVGRFFLLIWRDLNHFSVGLRGIIGLEFGMRGRFKFCVFLGVLPARVSWHAW